MVSGSQEIVNTLVVCAAVIERDGLFLVTRRQKGVHLEGYWEFPGGKCRSGETLTTCLSRELREELDVEVDVKKEVFTTTHVYPERAVELHFLKCDLRGKPIPRLGQQIRWATRDELAQLPFPPADIELIRMLTRGTPLT